VNNSEVKLDFTHITDLKHALPEVIRVMSEGDGRTGRARGDWRNKPESYFVPKLLRHTVTAAQEGALHVDDKSSLHTLAHVASLALYLLDKRLSEVAIEAEHSALPGVSMQEYGGNST